MKELGDKAPAELKSEVEAKVAALRKTAEGEQADAIKAAIADFEQTMQRLYQQAGGAGAQAGPGAAAGAAASKGGDEDIKDADFEVK